MLKAEQLEWYRLMTPRERIELMLELMDLGWDILRRQGPELTRRSIEAINKRHRSSVEAILAALGRQEGQDGQTSVS